MTTIEARHARPMNLTRSLRLVATTLATGVCGVSLSVAPSATAASPAASWQWPLAPLPPLIRPFDPPEAPWLPGHRGIDLGATPGQPVLAVAAGTVTYAGEVAGVGVVTVDHGDLRSTYQPVVVQVQAGQHVEAGTVLGAVVTVGSHCLPASCLHLGARRGDDYLDPLRLLAPLPVRLKPITPSPHAPTWSVPFRPVGPARPSLLALGPRMSLAIGRPEPLGGHMGVDLRRGQRGVTEQLLHGAQVGSALEQVGRGAVTQPVRA